MVFERLARRAVFLPLLATFLLASSACAKIESTPEDDSSMVPAEDGLYAVFKTSMGDIVAKLHYEKVPVTVANFVGLAEGTLPWTNPETNEEMTNTPLYSGTIFHRVIPDFMIQGGDPLGNGRGGPGYRFKDEFDPELRHDGPGVLSMANSGPGTNGSQFFITHRATPHLDNRHSVFGKVVEGQQLVTDIAAVDKGPGDKPTTDIVLNEVEIVRRGSDAEAFDAAAVFNAYREDEVQAQERAAAEAAAQVQELLMAGQPEGTEIVTTDSGLKYVVLETGDGVKPTAGQTISAHYTGTLLDGTEFDSSYKRNQPIQFPVGKGNVIRGWDEALLDMQVGEKRRLAIPPELAYGPGGRGPIPPNATLMFDVELVSIQD